MPDLQSPSIKQKEVNIALAGNPNVGKSSLFNELTGLNQKVSNFPGVTVEKKIGSYKFKGSKVRVTDLPGAYSLSPNSEDEKIAYDYIQTCEESEIIIVVADGSNLKRNLLLCSQIIDTGKPVILVINMMDLVERNKLEIDIKKLSDELGIPVVPVNARIGKGIDHLKDEIVSFKKGKSKAFLELFDKDDTVGDTRKRYAKINEIVRKCVNQKGEGNVAKLTHKVDNIVTHRIWGFLIFLFILFIMFQAIFSWSTYPMELIEEGFLVFSNWLRGLFPGSVITALFADGIIPGLGGIAVFVPQITMLFAFIAVLEDTGYMSRVSFIMDRLLRNFGLNGRSVIPLLSGAACAVPAIMGARTIGNKKERLITIFVTPLMSCSARIPVYTLLIGLLIPADEKLFIFNKQGVVMMGMYLIGFFAALFTAWAMKFLMGKKEKTPFVMEMPIYRQPRWSSIGLTIVNKVKVFLFEAGKIIIAISLILWVLSSYGPGNKFEEIEKKYSTPEMKEKFDEDELATKISTEKLSSSYAGMLGKSIEPAIEPLGFDWKIGIAVVTSFAAREVFVGTMATLYSVGSEENTKSIREKMMEARNPDTGEMVYSRATGYSLLIFYAFALQCMATVAIVKRETRSWKWPILQVLYMGGLAYFASFVVYRLLS